MKTKINLKKIEFQQIIESKNERKEYLNLESKKENNENKMKFIQNGTQQKEIIESKKYGKQNKLKMKERNGK